MADKLVNTADSVVHNLAFALRLGDMVQNGLNHKVAKFIVDENLDAFKADSDQVLLPLTLRCCNAVFDDLTAMFIPRYRREMLHDRLKNYRPTLVCPDQIQALS